ncbi:hypothetical protein BJY21_001406 [Kineosphaera limosa]|nr:hypothetical protein [Kineosphaera limosa]NYE00222.1 hypothetical protein [Kineosphaera limosa]
MLSVDLAQRLAAAGVMWHPAPGDRFTITAEQLLGDVFWISELTIELHHYGGQSVLGFNGTTEWALDSVSLDQALWIPREDQLRELLGDRLLSVHRNAAGWRVVTQGIGGDALDTDDADLECAYARALLAAT